MLSSKTPRTITPKLYLKRRGVSATGLPFDSTELSGMLDASGVDNEVVSRSAASEASLSEPDWAGNGRGGKTASCADAAEQKRPVAQTAKKRRANRKM